ncbi:hypothetical protein [Photobacterium damselae]|uniref:hypothetical protein n=1 Tax=Photobacterium damselae TaxID=38293 RepID=UPI000D8BEF58|nr:hypothetical protein [Photobacterium damselae]NVO74504.1 hypothetical protein [Photobacterium damselae subsp. damselae]SPY31229.1 Uncharacterised protein [Photobacterium damselae]
MWTYNLPPQCPPAEAEKKTIEVYRLVEVVPSVMSDWLPHVELDKIEPPKTPHKEFNDFEICCRHGLSVFTKLKCVKSRKKLKKFKNYKIIKGTINPSDGYILQTFKKSHHTWWLQSETPSKNFVEVAIDE